jgi:RNA recognition motif-containing protein
MSVTDDVPSQITRIKIPLDAASQPKHFAYVEFGNDEDLQVALNKHKDVSCHTSFDSV